MPNGRGRLLLRRCLLSRAPPGGPAADRSVPHLGAAPRAGAAGTPGRDDVAGVHSALGDGGPQGRLERAVQPVSVLAPQAVRPLDQSRIAGVGNLLADEILWQARVSPAERTNGLRRQDADRLYRALQSALRSAIAKGGVHTGDVIASRRPGGTCPRCGAEMRHGTVGGRSTWWCSREQVAAEVGAC